MKLVILAGCLVLGLVSVASAAVRGSLSFQGDSVHLELEGQQHWDYELKRLEVKGQVVIELSIPALDEASAKTLSEFRSDFVTKVSVDRGSADGKTLLRLNLAGENIETFDYLTDQPSRLIVDFFENPNLKKGTKPANAESIQKRSTEKLPKKRTPASTDVLTLDSEGTPVAYNNVLVRTGIFDGGDPEYDRFLVKDYEIKEEALIRSNDNYYMAFPLIVPSVAYWDKMRSTPVIFEITRENTEENKQARLLLTLFEKKRFGIYLKTEKWFTEKYPDSKYNEVIDFMTADVYLALSDQHKSTRYFNEAIKKYKQGVQKYPQSPLSERTALKIGYLTLDHGDFYESIRLFEEYFGGRATNQYGALSRDLARLGTALALTRLNRTEPALAQLNEIETKSQNKDLKVDAAYRRGDVWVKANNYPKAVEEYEKAIKKFPEGQQFYPSAFFNQAESLFWMKKYRQSLDVHREFIKRFPDIDHTPFSITRIGELLEVLGVEKTRVMGAYLEAYFRFGDSSNTFVARLRLLSNRIKSMKPKELKFAVDEVMKQIKESEIPNIEQFANVMIADGYNRRGEFTKAIEILSKYYKDHPHAVDVKLFTNRIVQNINEKIHSEIQNGRFIDGLKTHTQYSDSWLKNSERLDTKYYIGRAFEMAGVPLEAEKYYRETINRIYAIRGTPRAKEVAVKENVPSEDELNLRMAAVSFEEQKNGPAYQFLKNIKSPELLSENSQIERVDLAVSLLERRGDLDSAVRYLGELVRTWKGQPELVAGSYLKLAQIQSKLNRPKEAIQALEMISTLQKDSAKVPGNIHSKSLEMLGEIYLEQKNPEQAIAAFQTLLEKYEEDRPLASYRYKLGQILFEQGSIQKAADAWSGFKGEKTSFWRNLAQEQLKNSSWRDEYKKYIKRIPAMSESAQGK